MQQPEMITRDRSRFPRLLALALAAFFALAGSSLSAPASAHADGVYDPPFWRLDGRQSRVFLLGSIHLGRPDFYPVPDHIEKSFLGAAQVAVEADIENSANRRKVAELIAEHGYYPPNEGPARLRRGLSPRAWQILDKATGPEGARLKNMRPWLLSLSLTVRSAPNAAVQGWELDPSLGIDAHFIRRVGQRQKLVELEGVTRQVRMFSGFPERAQFRLLEKGLLALDRPDDGFRRELKTLADSWKSGGLDELAAITRREFAGDADLQIIYEAMYPGRNAVMAEKIRGWLENGRGDYFVIVGAGHTVGPRSILDFLARHGYKAQRLRGTLAPSAGDTVPAPARAKTPAKAVPAKPKPAVIKK